MRISDWSSDVCSSDLQIARHRIGGIAIARDDMAAKRVVEDGRSLRRLVAMRLDIAVSIDIVLPAREQRDPIEELERERRMAEFGDKATDAVRDLDMLERKIGREHV